MTLLASVLGFFGDVIRAIAQPLLLLWAGRRIERGARAERDNEVKDGQIDAALDRPRDQSDLVDRLRRNGL